MFICLFGCSSQEHLNADELKVVDYIQEKYDFTPTINKGVDNVFECTDEDGNVFNVSSNKDDYQKGDITLAVFNKYSSDDYKIVYGDDYRVNTYFDGENLSSVTKGCTAVFQYLNKTSDNIDVDEIKDYLGADKVYVLHVDTLIDMTDMDAVINNLDTYYQQIIDYNISDEGFKEIKYTEKSGIVVFDKVKIKKVDDIDLYNFSDEDIVTESAVTKSFQIDNISEKNLKVMISAQDLEDGDMIAYRYVKDFSIYYETMEFTRSSDRFYFTAIIPLDSDSVKFTVVRRN
jgi:hypothetical protein